jgi:hypothetical protein
MPFFTPSLSESIRSQTSSDSHHNVTYSIPAQKSNLGIKTFLLRLDTSQ